MSEKSLINSVETCVEECLRGFIKLQPNLKYYESSKVVINTNENSKAKVSLISGGGSGHEPFPAGYVGDGMLAASVSGAIFTSPSSTSILHAIRESCSKNILLIVPNYTGDVLNFGLAAEIASSEGVQVDCLIVGEDIAQEIGGIQNKAGKRGLCGILFVFKILGYLSWIGENLQTIKKIGKEIIDSMATLGVCLAPCSKPGVGALFYLEENKMELGLGVHGEAGIARLELLSARESVKMLLSYLLKFLKIEKGDVVAAMINNLGSLSCVEQWIVAGEVEKQLSEIGIEVIRLYAGCFFTSLNMSGVQICLLKLNSKNKKLFLDALDFETTAFSWSKKVTSKTPSSVVLNEVSYTFHKTTTYLPTKYGKLVKEILKEVGNDLTKAEDKLNELDSICGDGDCGSTLASIAKVVLSKSEDIKAEEVDVSRVFFELSVEVQGVVGGTSGALYALFLKGVSDEIKKLEGNFTGNNLPKFWRAGVDVIKKYSTARVGDRTMLDSLETGCSTFEEEIKKNPENIFYGFKKAVEASKEGSARTKSMKALAGRASYTDPSQQVKEDAGAFAVTVWLSATLKVLDCFYQKKI